VGQRTVYRNRWYGLTLEHPAGWQVMPTLRGDQIMVNPVDGRRYEVPLSYGTYWSDAVQRVYRTTDPNAPPVIGANRLEPI
jgi:hypothetical protein